MGTSQWTFVVTTGQQRTNESAWDYCTFEKNLWSG
jgi:hypothetical protein